MKVCLTIILLLAGVVKLHASEIDVCLNCETKSIKEAISKANHGDTINIGPGEYKEGTVVIDKPLHLIGQDWPVIDGESKYEIFQIISDSVLVEGIEFRNVGMSYIHDNAAVSIEGVSHCKVFKNRFRNAFFGVYAKNSDHIEIIDNELYGEAKVEISSGNAIHIWYCKNMVIRNNKVLKHRDGIYLEFVDNSIIENNLSEGNLRYGLHFMFSNRDTYRNNTFRNNGAGVAVMFSKEIEMSRNTFELNWGTASYGLLLKEINDAKIIENRLVNNTIGIFAEGANRIDIKENLFIGNGWALKISGSCTDNVVSRNNFISNTFDLSTDSSRNYNTFDGNYWSDYTGYDLNKDGRGDVPYRPVKLFSYMVGRVEPSIVLLRSFFVDIIDFAEKVTPMFTPQSLIDNEPLMQPWEHASDN